MTYSNETNPKELILVANPGSQSRKYALFQNQNKLASLHFETINGQIHYSLSAADKPEITQPAVIAHLAFAATKILEIFKSNGVLSPEQTISKIAVRIVAPSSYFQEHRVLDANSLQHLQDLRSRAIIHINNVLQELELLQTNLAGIPIIGVSDSAYDATEKSYIHAYAIPLKDARTHDIWRFGYHGLSINSAVDSLKAADKLADKVVICHLGGGASVTALRKGLVVDTSMGYSPLDGLMMATRSGSIDPTAVYALQKGLGLSNDKMQEYLNFKSGLLGVSGISDDIRVLLENEKTQPNAKLALDMYVSRIQQAIGQMVAVLGGIDDLVFTGTVGERSAIMRKRIVKNFNYLHLSLDAQLNRTHIQPDGITEISPVYASKKILILPCDEAAQIAKIASRL